MTVLMDGKALSQSILASLKEEVAEMAGRYPVPPKLSVVLVGDDPASHVYVNKKAKTARQIGLESEVVTFETSIDEDTLRREIQRLNRDESVHGILVQLPLPRHINTQEILALVSPDKDVDGFNPINQGKLLAGDMPDALPCTPAGVMALLKEYDIPLTGKHAVVVGRSNIVGKPVGLLLLQENATVTFCHSRTKNLSEILRTADVIVSAVGVPEMIKGDDVRPGAVVIDVGINRVPETGKLVGDVHFESVSQKASHITPVPGGVGPMTIATLMSNTLTLYRKSLSGVPAS